MTTTTLPRKACRIPIKARTITPMSLGEQFTHDGATYAIWSDGPNPRSVWAINDDTRETRAFRMPDPKKETDWKALDDADERTDGWKALLAAAVSGQSIVTVTHFTV